MRKISFITASLLLIASSSIFGQAKPSPGGATPTARPADMFTMLQGRWVSLDDKKTSFEIKGYRQTDFYDKEVLNTATINLYRTYPEKVSENDPNGKNGNYLVVRLNEGDYSYYKIDKLTAKDLILLYLPEATSSVTGRCCS